MRILILGYSWFDRVNGNSYCRSKIYIDGQLVNTTDVEYGYGGYYIQAALEWLDNSGLVPKREPNEATWSWKNRTGLEVESQLFNVKKRELYSIK